MNLPNKLTIGRVIAVPFFIICYYLDLNIWATVIFLLASITDMLDGRIARKRNLVTNFGKIMDPLADKILVYSAFCLFVYDDIMPAWMLIIILAREFLVAGVRTVAASRNIVIAADWSGKLKTTLQMVAVPALMLVPVISQAGAWGTVYSIVYFIGVVALWLALAATIYSGISYTVKNIGVFKDEE